MCVGDARVYISAVRACGVAGMKSGERDGSSLEQVVVGMEVKSPRMTVELLTVPIFEAADALGPSIPHKEVISDAAVGTSRETATKGGSFIKNVVVSLLTVPIFEAADAIGARK